MSPLGRENTLSTTAQLAVAMPAHGDRQESSIDLSDDAELPADEYGFEMTDLSQLSYASEQLHPGDAAHNQHTASETDIRSDEFYTITL